MKKIQLFAAAILACVSFAGAAEINFDFDGKNQGGRLALQNSFQAAGAGLPAADLAPADEQAASAAASARTEGGLGGVDPVRYLQDDYYRNVKNLDRAVKQARAGRARTRGTGRITIVNLGEDFKVFLAKAENADLETQIAAWKQLEARFPAGMASFIFNTDEQGLEAARRKAIPWFMKRMPAYKAGMLKLFEAGPARIEAAFANFKTTFPDYSPDITVYLLPSMFHFNACAWPGNIAFGPDMMLTLGETESSFSLTTAHEVFHTYSFSKIPGEMKTFSTPLWLEGSATFASGLLTPEAGENDLLLDKVLAARCADPAFVQDLAAQYRPLLAKAREGEEGAAIQNAWYGYYQSTPENPSRRGYCLGLQVFKRLAAKHGLAAMMTWPEPEFSAVMDTTLADMASGR